MAVLKEYVTPERLRYDSFVLGTLVYHSNFRPDFMIALWRGGAPVGCYVQEILDYAGLVIDHIAIRTSKYCGIDQTHPTIKVHNLAYLIERVTSDSKILIVDDISDTGKSIEALTTTLSEKLGERMPASDHIKIATLYSKPSRNQTGRHPDYYVNLTDKWVVFPHELRGLTMEEIAATMGPGIVKLLVDLHTPVEDNTA